MANYIFDPAGITESVIEETGIDPEAVYNEQDGVQRAQLTVLSQASAVLGGVTYVDSKGDKKTTTLKENVYSTIHRLHASANKKNIDFAANIKNTLYNTIQFEVMNQLEAATTTKEKQKTMIKWLPSTAEEIDPFHALNYGKTMTLEAALKKGLGTRYGCQCSMEILSTPASVEEKVKDIDPNL